MARCTDGNALCNRILDAEESANERCCDGSRNTRNDNCYDGHGRNTADLFRNYRTHRNRDGLRNERKHECLAQTEKFCTNDNANNACRATNKNPRKNGQPVFFERLDVPVQGDCENDGYRPEKKRNIVSADFVSFVINTRNCEKPDDENGGDKYRVQERVAPLVADRNSDFISDNGKNNSEHGLLWVAGFAFLFLAQ